MSPDRAGMLTCEVARRVEYDVAAVRAEIRRRLREPSDEYIWIRGDRFAAEALGDRWAGELDEACRRALGEVHEQCLLEAAVCLEVSAELERSGLGSWVAGAVLYQLGFDALFDVLGEDEFGGSVELWEEDGDSRLLA